MWKAENIVLRSVEKRYGSLRVLGPLDLVIPRGVQVALVGESGSGKSTFLNLLGCMDQPTSGELELFGREVATADDAELSRIRLAQVGYVHQFFDLVEDLSALENALLPLWLAGRNEEEPVREVLRELRLGERFSHLPSELSGGEQQRVAIARALALDPPLMLADEPTGSLDSQNAEHILELLLGTAQAKGKTLIMATHSESAAERFPHRIRLADGKVVETTL